MAQPGSNVCFKCGINSTDALYCTNCYIANYDNNDDDEKKEGGDERRQFLDESIQKKQYYTQYPSLSSFANSGENKNDIDDTILVDDPHFVVTLTDLSDFIDNNNNNDNYSEVDKLKELKNCIENKQQNPIIDNMRVKLGTVYGVDPSRVIITDIFYGTTNIGYVIVDYLKSGVEQLIKNAAEFMNKMNLTLKKFKEMVITPPPESTDGSYTVVKSYHVSCASGKGCGNWNCPEENCRIAGVVLYMKDGQTKWRCNGRSCRTGYIIVKKTKDIPSNITSRFGLVHGIVYKSVFNEEPDGIVGSGFSRSKGKWRFRSGSFNGGETNNGSNKGKYHKGGSTMNTFESEWVEKAIKNWWDTGNQNTKVTQSLVIFKD